MRFKLLVSPILTVIFLFAVLPAFAQTLAPYQGRVLPLTIGFGPSGFEPDWYHGRMYGGTVWVDWYPTQFPAKLSGLGLEIEARDISLDKHLDEAQADPQHSGQANTKEDTLGAGAIYNFRVTRNFHPYLKAIFSQGSIDFISNSPTYSHDTRLVSAGGVGFQYRIFRPIWARVDYEYQFWTGRLLGDYLTPSGYTVGISYDFSHATP
jgi:hypothetical protein